MLIKIQILAPNTPLSKIYADLYRNFRICSKPCIAIAGRVSITGSNFIPMFSNHLKTAWRNIINNKFYAAINVTGLTFGLVIGLYMLLRVQDELSFDVFNKKSADICKIGIVGGTDVSRQIFTSIVAPVVTFAKSELPEVKDGVRIMKIGSTPFKYKDKIFIEDNIAFTDASYFSVFDFNLVDGDKKNPFVDNNSIVITSSLAKKYFGNEDPIGKAVIVGFNESARVTGIIDDYPANSSFKYNILLPHSRFNQLTYLQNNLSYNGTSRITSMDANWVNFSFETYLLLKPNTDIGKLEIKLQKIHERINRMMRLCLTSPSLY